MTEPFWTFSLRFYELPGVAESCIQLQDCHGADVNLILFALWTAALGHQLDAETIAAADTITKQWRETVTQPLRAARRALKTPPHHFDQSAVTALRQQVMAAELEAERLQQAAMTRDLKLDARPPSLTAAQQNLSQYAAFLGTPPETAAVEQLLKTFATHASQPAPDAEDGPLGARIGTPIPSP